MAGGERLHAAGVHTGSQILDLWIHLKITFPHHHVFPDKTGLMMEGGAFPMIYDWYIQQQTEAAYGLAGTPVAGDNGTLLPATEPVCGKL
ncbi:hypothetical protein JGV24_002568 [Salmonella enterica]|nr:hypothetical protein [Salmonella enterica]